MKNRRITSISVYPTRPGWASGFKAQLFEETLSGCDLFVGPNGSGKTTRLLVPVVAVIGLADTQTDPVRPYLQAEITNTSVRVCTDDGQVLIRDLSAGPRTKASKVADEEGRRILGRLPTAWDLSDFSAATIGDRAKILDTVARAGGQIESWDADRAQRELVTLVPEAIEWHRQCVHALPTADDGATWLRYAMEWCEARRREAHATAQGLAGIVGDPPPDAPQGAETDRQRAETLRDEMAAIRLSEQVRDREILAREQHIQRGDRLAADVERTIVYGRRLREPEPEPVIDDETPLIEAVRRAEEEASGPDGSEEIGSLSEAARAADEALVEAQRAEGAALVEERRASQALHEARGAMSALASDAQHGRCLACGAEDPLGIVARRDDGARRVGALTAAWDQARATLTSAQTRTLRAAAVAEEAQHRVEEAQHRVAETRRTRAVTLAHARQRADAARRTATRLREEWEQRERRRREAIQQARETWAAAARAREEWERMPMPVVPADHAQEREQRRAEIQAELSAIRVRDEARAAHRALVEARARRAQAAIEAQESYAAIQAYVLGIRSLRDRLAAAAYAPIERAARELVEGVDGLPMPYFLSASDYGADRGDGRVGYHDLSESEQRISAACLVYALARVSATPCRLVLLDGLEVVQPSRRAPLLAALARARARGLVDSVITTMACDGDEAIPEVEGVTIHRLRIVDAIRSRATAREVEVEDASEPAIRMPVPEGAIHVIEEDYTDAPF